MALSEAARGSPTPDIREPSQILFHRELDEESV